MSTPLLILIVVVLAVIGFLFDAFILHLITKLVKVEKPDYKTALKMSLVSLIIEAALWVILSGVSELIIVIIELVCLYILLQKFYKTGLKKNITILATYLTLTVLLYLAIIIPVRLFVLEPFFVAGKSMEPAFNDSDYILIEKIDKNYQRSDVIIFRDPSDLSEFNIKRIIGLPGEKVEIKDNKIMIYNAEKSEGFVLDESSYLSSSVSTAGEISQQIGEGEYYVLGDNRSVGSDSRSWGVLAQKNIIGKFWIKP